MYEIAKEIGIPNKDLIAKIRALGLEVNNHMSSLDADDVQRIKRSLEKEKASVAAPAQTQKLSSGTVLRRRSSGDKSDTPEAAPAAPAPVIRRRVADGSGPEVAAAPTPAPAPVVRRREPEPVVAKPEPRREAEVETPRAEPKPVVRAQQRVEEEEAPRAEPPKPVVQEAQAAPRAEPPKPEPKPEPTIQAEPAPQINVEPRAVDSGPRVERAVQADPPAAPQPREDRVVERAPAPVATTGTPPPSEPAPTRAPSRSVILPAPQVMRREEPRASQSASPGGGMSTSSGGMSARSQMPPQGNGNSEPPPSTPLPTRVRQPGEGPSREVIVTRGPRTVEEVAGGARSRFEMELERARARTADRPATEAPPIAEAQQQEALPPAPAPRDPSRPAVGTVIALPPRIKITERTPMAGRPAPGPQPVNPIRGRFAQQQQRGGPRGPGGRPGSSDFGRKKLPLGKKGKSTTLTTPAEHKRVIRIEDSITVADLAKGMGVKAPEVLKKLWGMGMTGVNINASIDFDTAQL
ncbi:MAG: translation initiation factor IF-2 N-terminal domain-containing protein, partial [Deltaproteobacteria bacterium]|nr:translation initiation factor IF-2 N-terminal domain-containing protein [Deltaproteobacteria bacterium]